MPLLIENLRYMNNYQLKAVTCKDKILRIVAGAGTGKTFVLTNKIAYMIYKNMVNPNKVLALTFTNKAAKEMKERISNLVKVDNIEIGTFHSFCLNILYEFQNILKITNFTIMPQSDCRKQIKKLAIKNNIKLSEALMAISKYKSLAVDINKLSKDSPLVNIYKNYQKFLKKNNSIDFDDMLMLVYNLLSTNKPILEKIRNRYDSIFVDEFQDTNNIQMELLNLLYTNDKYFTIVGDHRQSIYEWRYADPSIFVNFDKMYNCRTIELNINYRSTNQILKFSNNILNRNINDTDIYKTNLTSDKFGAKLIYNNFNSKEEEIKYICNEIIKLRKLKFSYKDIVILARSNVMLNLFESIFVYYDIPYKLVNSFSMLDRVQVKMILNFFNILRNKNDLVSLSYLLSKFVTGFGEKTINKYMQNNDTIEEVFNEIIKNEKSTTKKRKTFDAFLYHFNKIKKYKSSNKIIEYLIDYLIKNNKFYDKETNKNNIALADNIKEFLMFIGEQESNPLKFSNVITLNADLESDEDKDRITLTTVHSAKGLEWPIVFFIRLSNGSTPNPYSNNYYEELRIMYVAATRAKDLLYLTSDNFYHSFEVNNAIKGLYFTKSYNYSILN